MTNVRFLKAASSDAAGLLAQAIKTNDEGLALSAIDLFSDVMVIATAKQQFKLMPDIISEQLKAYNFKELVESHRLGKLSEPLFRLVVETFRPSYWDLNHIEKSRISIDKILIDSYLIGNDPSYAECIRLLDDLSVRASHQAMASVLLQAIDRLKDASEKDLRSPTVFEVINRYNKDFTAKKPLPAHLISLINEHEATFLDLNPYSFKSGSEHLAFLFSMQTLSQLHAAGNRTLVAHMAGEHARHDTEDPWVLVKAQALGANIPLASVDVEIQALRAGPNYTSNIVYALHDDEVAFDFITVPVSTPASKLTPLLEAIGVVFDAIPEGEQPGKLLLEKTEHVVVQLFKLPYKAELILDHLSKIAHIPRDLLLSFPAAREQLLCLDLGL